MKLDAFLERLRTPHNASSKGAEVTVDLLEFLYKERFHTEKESREYDWIFSKFSRKKIMRCECINFTFEECVFMK